MGEAFAFIPSHNQFILIYLGNILYKDLFSSFPYYNTIDMVELSGADLKRSLNNTGFVQVQGKVTYIVYSTAEEDVLCFPSLPNSYVSLFF